MKPQEYKTLLQETYEKIKKEPITLSPLEFSYFADIAKYCKQGKIVLENWELFLSNHFGTTPLEYFDWCTDQFLDDKNEDNPFREVMDIEKPVKKNDKFKDIKKLWV